MRVNEATSDWAPVLSGIPQGSVLGPLLFVIYINDLPDVVASNLYLFADDTKLTRRIRSKEDACALQQDIDLIEAWGKTWLLTFNPEKCHVLTIGKFENIQHTQRYEIYSKEMEHVFVEKDLGVLFDADLTFQEHITTMIKKANAMVGLIRRSFTFLDCNMPMSKQFGLLT